jgi:hypothetical protein
MKLGLAGRALELRRVRNDVLETTREGSACEMDDPDEAASTSVGTELLFENDIVRVWEMRLDPGESSPVHRHRCDYLIAYVDSLEGDISRQQASTQRAYDSGYVAYLPVPVEGSEEQRLSNAGGRFHRHFVIEFLGLNDAAPESNNGRERR